ncbi:hypothetical protein GH714_027057 [Hevea brasiliensis]|uniref:Cytochrome P450 n=1 Tax=Hevea brasiliensis TaxID=3981 RepID=A0A6A6MG20_HEVBR|nr:hypothetical protein GH714_027057 [Hevea brasiliensis]
MLGCPCVMISSPEAARVVLVKRAHLFKPTYPTSKEKMIGPEAISFNKGLHARLKKLVQASFLPSAIKGSASEIEQIVLVFLPTWKYATISTLQEMKRVPPRSNTYMPFGNGVHSCPGSELAKLQTLILLHHLTITYRWRAMEDEDGIEYAPFPVPKRGLPIRLTPRPNHKLAKSD